MGKRYYCDYCDSTFPDTAQNRKRHMNGIFHQRCRKVHYLSFRDAETILLEDSVKRPCRNFQQLGKCEYGVGCKYTHYTPQQLEELRLQIRAKKDSDKMTKPCPKVEDWLEKWSQKSAKYPVKKEVEEEEEEVDLSMYSLPPSFNGIPDLPPSVLPPKPGVYPLSFEVWG